MMSGLDEGFHDNNVETDDMESPSPSNFRPLRSRSMDMEFHDLNLDESDHFEGNVIQKVFVRNGSHLCIGDDHSIPDDDTFGEASIDQEPDEQYLEDLLDEDYHPERLNLLDTPRVKKSQRKNAAGKNGSLGDEDDISDHRGEAGGGREGGSDCDEEEWKPGGRRTLDVEESETLRDYEVELSDHPSNAEDDLLQYDSDGRVNSGDATGEGDPFDSSPSRMPGSPRRTLKKQLERMGESTKKSFRTVGNQLFFTQPFKGLGRSLSDAKRRKDKELDQPGVTSSERVPQPIETTENC